MFKQSCIVRNHRRTQDLIARYPVLEDLFRYFENNYLNGNFPPRMWNVFDRPMEIRTNNFVESSNKRWNDAVQVRHPSLWVFIYEYSKISNLSPKSRCGEFETGTLHQLGDVNGVIWKAPSLKTSVDTTGVRSGLDDTGETFRI